MDKFPRGRHASILPPKSDQTASLINPATATSDLSVPSPLQRPQTEVVRTPLIVMVSPPLMNTVHSRIFRSTGPGNQSFSEKNVENPDLNIKIFCGLLSRKIM